ncbi:MAG TPA: FAD-binding oxidoreductase [Xanthomonadaceae bacterium]|nr:FAD-binding oxidoreductase [Xanthomonadaceae bacterium]
MPGSGAAIDGAHGAAPGSGLHVHFDLKLVSSRMVAPTVRHLAFVRGDGAPLDYVPGQFLQVHFRYPDGTPTKRSYSIASVREAESGPGDPVELAVSYVPGGAATDLFEHLHEGQCIEASGPYGRFCLMPNDENRRYLLIATGTGITPYRAMLPQLRGLIAARGVQVVLLFGARHPGELLYGEEFERFAQANPGFRFVPCFSRQPRAHPHRDDRRGYVQDVLPEFVPDAETDIAYLCGNPDMVDACFAALKERGFPVPRVRREKYVSSR